jgi:hypothetical protein
MGLRAALGLSAAAPKLYRDKISPRQRPAAARNFKLPQNSINTRDKHNPRRDKISFQNASAGRNFAA